MAKDLFKKKKQKKSFWKDDNYKKGDFKKELGKTAVLGGSIILLAEGLDAIN